MCKRDVSHGRVRCHAIRFLSLRLVSVTTTSGSRLFTAHHARNRSWAGGPVSNQCRTCERLWSLWRLLVPSWLTKKMKHPALGVSFPRYWYAGLRRRLHLRRFNAGGPPTSMYFEMSTALYMRTALQSSLFIAHLTIVLLFIS